MASLPSSPPLGPFCGAARAGLRLCSPCCEHSHRDPHPLGQELGARALGVWTRQEGSERGRPPPLPSRASGLGVGCVPPSPPTKKKEKGTLIKGDRPVWWRNPIALSICLLSPSRAVVPLISPHQNARNKSACTLTLTPESPPPRSSRSPGNMMPLDLQGGSGPLKIIVVLIIILQRKPKDSLPPPKMQL